MIRKYKFIFGSLILAGFMTAFSSCREDDFVYDPDATEEENPFVEGPSLSVTLTIDYLGGEPAPMSLDPRYDQLIEDESYLDPQNCRILFFDSNDNFLFESMSRYVKKLETTSGEGGRWTVTIPFYNYGNDRDHSYGSTNLDYDWDFKAIKEAVEKNDFKIAILANHPERDFNMGIKGRDADTSSKYNKEDIPGDVVVADQWYRNDGPNWTRKNSVCYTGADKDVKTLLDLHHCQTDLIYKGKNHDQYHPGIQTSGFGEQHVKNDHTNLGFYDAIVEYDPKDVDRQYPMMSPTVGWVDFRDDDSKKDSYGFNFRVPRLPDKDYPIPMYGIQKFEKIGVGNWIDGSTFRLDRKGANPDKAISLLRSCVKLELFIPKEYTVDLVTLFYANVYSRCEPMNVWDATETIWSSGHDLLNPDIIKDDDCEWKRIYKFGPMTSSTSYSSATDSKNELQRKHAWQYGCWADHDWHFGKGSVEAGKAWAEGIIEEYDIMPPQVFNPCVQRNTTVVCEKNIHFFDDVPGYYHIVMYTGERAVNDGSNLTNIGNTGSGNPTAAYWQIFLKPKGTAASGTGYRVSIPITDYTGNNSATSKIPQVIKYTGTPAKPANDMGTGKESSTAPDANKEHSKYLQNVQSGAAGVPKPYPLVRNHTYKMVLTGTSHPNTATRAGNGGDVTFDVRSEVKRSVTIDFNRAVMGGNIPTDVETLQPNLDTYTPSK